jgi:outer membrane protein assembly factor BamB
MAEVMRVLAPGGVAYVKTGKPLDGARDRAWRKTVKPWPKEIDEWTHYLHGPDNNAVAADSVVGPPRHVQWTQEPKSDRHHDTIADFRAVVSAGGRIFSIEDEGPIELPYLPGEWCVKARDAFNGKLLWRVPVEEWEPVTRPHRTGPVQQPRRLVAVGPSAGPGQAGRVYVTLGVRAAVTALDAATGKVVQTYKGTERTQEILFDRGVLYLVAGDPTFPTGLGYLQQRAKRYGHDLATDPSFVADPVCRVVAVDAKSGRELWRKSGADTKGYVALSLAVRGGRAVFQNAGRLLCMAKATGKELWRAARTTSIRNPGTPPTVVIGERAVYSADGKALIAFSLTDGRELWRAPSKLGHPVSGPNVYLIDDHVWLDHTGGRNSRTGELARQVGRPRKDTMGHHRCYRNKATVKYLLIGGNGVEFLPLGTQEDISHNFVRGTCQYGIVPCNGLLYATPDNCECNRSVKLNNYLALAAARKPPSAKQRTPRLQRGPAYGQIGNLPARLATARQAGRKSGIENRNTWPTFRHDAARSGATGAAVPTDLEQAWAVRVGGRLSQPVVAGGRIYVSAIDAHTLHALDERSGKVVWRFTAGARVDSPPTIYRGMALFGSTDGWVYCLRAADGELAWRFRAAPAERLIGAWDQLESAWPVHGSVLVVNDTLYCAAGRSTFLDGGIYLYGLDPATGEKRCERLFSGPWDESGRHQVVRDTGGKDVEGGLADILASDGKLLYLRNNAFDLSCRPVKNGIKPHLFASAGFLDDAWNHRTGWMVDTVLRYGGTPQWLPPDGRNSKPQGEILTFDGKEVFGFRAHPIGRHSVFDPRKSGYALFAGTIQDRPAVSRPEPAAARPAGPRKKAGRKGGKGRRPRKGPRKGPGKAPFSYAGRWLVHVPVAVRGMVRTGEALFLAGTPNVHDPKDPPGAVRGRRGGVLLAVSPSDGKELARYKLSAPPVFDGMVAAAGRLYIATRDGRVVCMSKEK